MSVCLSFREIFLHVGAPAVMARRSCGEFIGNVNLSWEMSDGDSGVSLTHSGLSTAPPGIAHLL